MKVTAVAIVAASTLFGVSASASEQTNILAKPGGSYELRTTDQALCQQVVKRAHDADLPPSDRPIPMVTAAGGAFVPAVGGALIADLIIMGIEEDRAKARALDLCMRNLGYVELPFTPTEADEYYDLPDWKIPVWEKAFFAQDLAPRFASIPGPVVPPLPDYRAEPMSQGGLKIDADSLAVPTPEIQDKGIALKGRAVRWRTAVLTTPIKTTDGTVRVEADAGTVFHQVDYRPQSEPMLRVNGATWCGPVREIASGNTAKSVYCFTGRDHGYDVVRPTGQPWFAGPYRDGFILPAYAQPIHLQERATDDLGPLDFEISVTGVNSSTVDLEAHLLHDGQQVEVLKRSIDFKDDRAELPLWKMRLVFDRTASHTVKVSLDQNGTGESWRPGG